MRFDLEDGALRVYFEGRVDSSNAPQIGDEVDAIRAANEHESFIIDIDNLEYISSAGLRVLLKLRKEENAMKIINASPEVYEIFEMTGFSEMINIEKAFRRLSVEGCGIIGQGAKGVVYRLDKETIVKVYKDPNSLPAIKRERELARKAFVLGIPTAIPYDVVRVGESYGSVFELLSADSYSTLIAKNPEKMEEYITVYADLLRQIHNTEVKPEDMPDIKVLVSKWQYTVEPALDEADAAKLHKLIADTPDTMNMLHCDYHTNNIMMQNGETLLIDMDTLSHGHPIFELANVYITYVGFGERDPKIVEKFIGLPYDTAKKIWKVFLPLYLQTDDEEKVKEVEDKVKLLSYVRLMRHVLRREGADSEEGKATVELCKKNIVELLGKIDTLTF